MRSLLAGCFTFLFLYAGSLHAQETSRIKKQMEAGFNLTAPAAQMVTLKRLEKVKAQLGF